MMNDSVHEDTLAALRGFAKSSLMKRTCMKVAAWYLNPRQSASVRDEFLRLDNANTGKITLSQLKSVLQARAQNAEVTEEALHAIGDSGEAIHYSKFLAAMVSSQIAVDDTLLKSTFRRFDVD